MLENFGNMGSGSELPSKLAKILKDQSKNQWKPEDFENFHEFLANFDLKKLILIKIKAILKGFNNSNRN